MRRLLKSGTRVLAASLLALSLSTSISCGVTMAQELHFAPVSGQMTSPFGWRTDPMTGGSRFHGGVDIAAASGVPIHVTQDGVVVYSGYYGGYGNVVVVGHGGGLYTLYGHASQRIAKAGDTVSRGQVIALVGSTGRSTGPHLHFEVHNNRQYMNPLSYLSALQTQQPVAAQPSRQVAYVQKASARPAGTGKVVQVVNGTDIQNVQF